MSEAERKQRLDYIKNRKRWIMILSAILCGLLLLTAISGSLFYRLNKSYYIDYQELGQVDYTVSLKENDFYNENIAEENQAYIASLIDDVIADFNYDFIMATNNVELEYTYSIDAIMAVTDRNSGSVIFDVEDSVLAQKSGKVIGNRISIDEAVSVDFEKYNELEDRFVGIYKLEGTESTLKLILNIDILGACDEFSDNSTHHYNIALNVPLSDQTVVMYSTSDNINDVGQILACGNASAKNVCLILLIVFAALAVIAAVALIVFSRLTINTDISYDIRVKKILRSYKTYIQRINNVFDENGYQVLLIDSLDEMLEIRDTLQLPILMSENIDRTSTKFMIPTDSNLLYLFEIRVDNYDEIYGAPKGNEHFERIVETDTDVNVLVFDENVDDNEIIEALEQPDVSLDSIDFIDEIDEEDEEGTEVVGVVWPERSRKNKIYRYDPNGEQLNDGDIVLVPSRDEAQNKDIIRKAAVAHGNHRVAPETIHHPLKKVIAIIKKKTQEAITPEIDKTK